MGKTITTLQGAFITALESIAIDFKIFPQLAPFETKGDFIVYERTNFTPQYTRRNLTSVDVLFTIVIVTVDYTKGVETVDDIMDNLHDVPNNNWQSVQITGVKESNSHDFFTQEITIKIIK